MYKPKLYITAQSVKPLRPIYILVDQSEDGDICTFAVDEYGKFPVKLWFFSPTIRMLVPMVDSKIKLDEFGYDTSCFKWEGNTIKLF
jgi:hypothetical protein